MISVALAHAEQKYIIIGDDFTQNIGIEAQLECSNKFGQQ